MMAPDNTIIHPFRCHHICLVKVDFVDDVVLNRFSVRSSCCPLYDDAKHYFKSEVIFSFDGLPVVPRAEHQMPLSGTAIDALIPLVPVAVNIFSSSFSSKATLSLLNCCWMIDPLDLMVSKGTVIGVLKLNSGGFCAHPPRISIRMRLNSNDIFFILCVYR